MDFHYGFSLPLPQFYKVFPFSFLEFLLHYDKQQCNVQVHSIYTEDLTFKHSMAQTVLCSVAAASEVQQENPHYEKLGENAFACTAGWNVYCLCHEDVIVVAWLVLIFLKIIKMLLLCC